jgi:hypothetical protein
MMNILLIYIVCNYIDENILSSTDHEHNNHLVILFDLSWIHMAN